MSSNKTTSNRMKRTTTKRNKSFGRRQAASSTCSCVCIFDTTEQTSKSNSSLAGREVELQVAELSDNKNKGRDWQQLHAVIAEDGRHDVTI